MQQSGYRNRLLPLPIPTRQPKAHNAADSNLAGTPYVTEPVWTQLAPVGRSSQYILFWYIAETLPPEIEVSLSTKAEEQNMAYRYPPKFESDMTIKQRVALEPEGYEPKRHENTGVDEEEALYDSCLLPIDEAIQKLRRGVSADVVRKGWEYILLRRKIEEQGP